MCPGAESPVGRAAWGAQVIPLLGHYGERWITLASRVTVEARLVTLSERASGCGPWSGSETGRQVGRRKTCVVTVRPWCQDPGMGDRGPQLWMAVCRKPPSQDFSSLCSDTSVPPTSQPYLGSKKREGFRRIGSEDEVWCRGNRRQKWKPLPRFPSTVPQGEWLGSPLSWAVPAVFSF